MVRMRYLGIDYGSRKVGVALSDESGTMGFPHGILENAPALLETLLALAAKEGAKKVVIGDSRGLDERDNAVNEGAHLLGDRLEESGLEVFYEDERFTSAQAARQFAPQEKSRKQKTRVEVDASAAALILTNFLAKPNHG
jgi:putative Holliday junction resolvase